ncbi:MAG: hypothetical protein M3N21_01340 [Actinomycetota bacterium]|nr:hypothetical protein [Actinomycetota bacterium]
MPAADCLQLAPALRSLSRTLIAAEENPLLDRGALTARLAGPEQVIDRFLMRQPTVDEQGMVTITSKVQRGVRLVSQQVTTVPFLYGQSLLEAREGLWLVAVSCADYGVPMADVARLSPFENRGGR